MTSKEFAPPIETQSDDVQRPAGPIAAVREQAYWATAVFVAAVAGAAYVWLADWPIGSHVDEAKKARFILTGTQDFHHPILMLQVAKAANFFLGYADPAEVTRLGRAISGMFGGLAVFATFVLGRLVVAPLTALAAAAAIAVTPLFVFHATFLKEDIYLAGPALLGLAGSIVLLDRPSNRLALVTGVAFGAALSTKLVAVLFLILALMMVLLACRATVAARLRVAGVILLATLLAFVAINFTALLDYPTIIAGTNREIAHAAAGHFDVVMPIWLTGGVMHLRDSLLPSLGWPLLAVGLAGLSTPFISRCRLRDLSFIALAALVWYLAHEISPLKPPGAERYMVPEGPLLVILAAAFFWKGSLRGQRNDTRRRSPRLFCSFARHLPPIPPTESCAPRITIRVESSPKS